MIHLTLAAGPFCVWYYRPEGRGDYHVFTTSVPQPQIGSADFGSNGGCRLSFQGVSKLTYSVWTSTNLTQWVYAGQARQLSPGFFEFVEQTPSDFDRRFYRLRSP